MVSEQVKSIAIVGGGSSGWMTALYLNKLYNHSQATVAITLIESPEIPTVGVGEATVHSIRSYFAAMGLDEKELLQATNGTLKTGIMFRNWMKPNEDGSTHEYFHSFDQQNIARSIDISSAWFLSKGYNKQRFDEATSISPHLIKDKLSPKHANSRPYEGVVPYGYHLDAIKMAAFMAKKGVAAGITHVKAVVDDVEVEGENIVRVRTSKGSFTADLFIDCTGFKGLLINSVKERKDNWQSFEDALPCNKAVAVQLAYSDDQEPKPYTEATALSNGWAWQIDLMNRRGTGYVYDGNRLSKDEAETELLNYLNEGNGREKEVLRTVHLDMNIGCLKEFWVGNCLALGLSGGFIEPLESTGLHLVNTSARLLGTHLTGTNTAQAVRDSYNKIMNSTYQDLKHFIVLHYCLTDRDDTEFWREVGETVQYCDGLKQKLATWQHKVCEFMDIGGGYTTMFSDSNYRSVLYGMKHYPQLNLAVDKDENNKMFHEFDNRVTHVSNIVMPYRDYLKNLHKPQKL
ncbi:tryptophan 7-halogenase [Colwellia sp. 75C3]|uniref:tryptophan halogenase family protein n=1 Tax=Colwellia sp. 75C3 TaxID=888425 RepID=UPI000C324C76|nr:tryptophan halogenase family protein [Colwellia sp. 75C3]PKG86273.1 tryptophan 7-halogenase [Colwellia sp. 75C3]